MWPAAGGLSRPWLGRSNLTAKFLIDMHLHLGKSRDGAAFSLGEILNIMGTYGLKRAVVFPIDEKGGGATTYRSLNTRILAAASRHPRLIPFVRLNPRLGVKAANELKRAVRAGARGVKLHPRSEAFQPSEAEALVDAVEKERLPVFLHTAHEPNCRPFEWEKIFRRHRRIPFILGHGGKDAFPEAIALARRYSHLWVETSTLSFWRTRVILKNLGPSRVVFGSDLPYSHPAVELAKFNLLLNVSDRRKVYSENPQKILGE